MAFSYDNLKLDKGMYQEAGRSFSQVLERQDPSEQYKGTSLEGLDAFQRQLKRFDIKVKGAGSDVVEKFFRTADSAVLFPEYIARSVRQGMEEGDILPHITAAVTRFDGMDYRSITAEAGGDSKQLRHVEEGAAIPATTIQVQSNLVKLRKRGRMLVASYEAVRYQKLDLFSVTLRQIGAHIARAQLEDAVDVLKNGDGNGNAASVFATAARSSCRSMSLSYSTITSLPCTISRAKRLSRPMAVPAGRTEVRSRLAPRGVVSLPVPWKFRPVRGF